MTYTKRELRDALNCRSWHRFYKVFMTPEVIRDVLKMSPDEYKARNEFTFDQSRALAQHFELPFPQKAAT